jgi:hypothetical protein
MNIGHAKIRLAALALIAAALTRPLGADSRDES